MCQCPSNVSPPPLKKTLTCSHSLYIGGGGGGDYDDEMASFITQTQYIYGNALTLIASGNELNKAVAVLRFGALFHCSFRDMTFHDV